MAKMMAAYATHTGKPQGTLRFMTSDGQHIMADSTPQSLEIEDGNINDVLVEQTGGTSG